MEMDYIFAVNIVKFSCKHKNSWVIFIVGLWIIFRKKSSVPTRQKTRVKPYDFDMLFDKLFNYEKYSCKVELPDYLFENDPWNELKHL